MKPSKLIVSVDSVIFGYNGDTLYMPLYKRGTSNNDPFPDCWSLAGGPLLPDETFEQACHRKLEEDLKLKVEYLEQLYTFGNPERDPRSRAISVSYFALTRLSEDPPTSQGSANARWFPINRLPRSKWAFDHKQIAQVALDRIKAKVTYEPIGFNLLDTEFSIPQLQSLYEAILERPLDRRNFAKKIHSFELLIPTQKIQAGRGRPTQLYKFNERQYQKLKKEGFVFDI